MSLSDYQQELKDSLALLTKCQGEIASSYAFAIQLLEEQRDFLLRSLNSLQCRAREVIHAAIKETNDNCLNEGYQP
jgi:1,6-anhydro-N-acetylmuramate kinase